MRNDLLKKIASYMVVAYLSAGVAMGSLLWISIPAMNGLGWAYYTLTWPIFVCNGMKACGTEPYIPKWVFTFKDPSNGG